MGWFGRLVICAIVSALSWRIFGEAAIIQIIYAFVLYLFASEREQPK